MPRPPAGEVSKRLKAKAIRVLADTIDDPGAALYLKVQSARTLLQQQKIEPKDEDEDEFPSGSGGRVVILKPGEKYDPAVHNPDGKVGIVLPAKVVILPSNGRENIAEERRLERLARLAEISIPDDEFDARGCCSAAAKADWQGTVEAPSREAPGRTGAE